MPVITPSESALIQDCYERLSAVGPAPGHVPAIAVTATYVQGSVMTTDPVAPYAVLSIPPSRQSREAMDTGVRLDGIQCDIFALSLMSALDLTKQAVALLEGHGALATATGRGWYGLEKAGNWLMIMPSDPLEPPPHLARVSATLYRRETVEMKTGAN